MAADIDGKWVRETEGKNGKPYERYFKAIVDSRNSLGEGLKRVQQGTI